MLSSRNNKEADILRGLQVGADDYIIKPLRPMVFLARVKAVLRRCDLTVFYKDGVFAYGDLKVEFGETNVTLGDRVVNLTPTEYHILWHLIKQAGKVVPNQTLLSLIWGPEYLEETYYLKAHVKNLRGKLGEYTADPRYIFTERGVGYRFAKVAT